MRFAPFFHAFARIGLLSFGGPAAQISVMHDELVTRRQWMDEDGFLSALSFCMMLPGPEAMQLATYSGWRLRGTWGGVIAGLLFVLPGALVMGVLCALYLKFGTLPATQALFTGVQAAVVVIVARALVTLARKSLKRRDAWGLAVFGFVAIAVLDMSFPLVVLIAALYGAFCAKAAAAPASMIPLPAASHLPRVIAIWGSLWAAPLVVLWMMGEERLLAIGLFFSKLAVVTFGGAYAVLTYMSQEVVSKHGWLSQGQMLDGLGLAETTPGPLILVTQFVGHLAASGPTGALGAGLIGATLTLWVTFVPCFLSIFVGAPYIEWIKTKPKISAALAAITAAVVGVIASLAWWFASHVLFGDTFQIAAALPFELPRLTTLDPRAGALALLAGLLIFGLKRGLIFTLTVVAITSVAIHHLLPIHIF